MEQTSAYDTAGGTATLVGATRPGSGRSDTVPTCSWLVGPVVTKPLSAIRMFADVPNHRTRRLFGRASP